MPRFNIGDNVTITKTYLKWHFSHASQSCFYTTDRFLFPADKRAMDRENAAMLMCLMEPKFTGKVTGYGSVGCIKVKFLDAEFYVEPFHIKKEEQQDA